MRWISLIAVWIIFAGGLTACQPAGPVPPLTGQTAAAPASPSATAEHTETQPALPGSTPEVTQMIPSVTPAAGAQQKMLGLAVEQLAKELGMSAGEISVVEIKPVVWRDASLGCPKPGIDYITVETPGFSIQLQAGDTVYTYHTDENRRVVRCDGK